MTDELEDLKCQLVLGHQSDGRSVHDEVAKALCRQHGASVSRLARECGVNANQVSRWLREHDQESRIRQPVASVAPAPATFIAVALPTTLPPIKTQNCEHVVALDLHARLPNGMAIDLHGVELRHVGEVIEALGRLRCSASTKA